MCRPQWPRGPLHVVLQPLEQVIYLRHAATMSTSKWSLGSRWVGCFERTAKRGWGATARLALLLVVSNSKYVGLASAIVWYIDRH